MDRMVSTRQASFLTTRRIAPFAAGGAVLVAAGYVAVVDPSAPGSRYPICAFHQLTGLWCPGCGLTRGTHELLHGDVVTALGMNVLLPAVLVAITAGWWMWIRRAWDRPTPRWLDTLPTRLAPAALVVVITFGVLRNLPFGPFAALAP